jgi:hypothetical protein
MPRSVRLNSSAANLFQEGCELRTHLHHPQPVAVAGQPRLQAYLTYAHQITKTGGAPGQCRGRARHRHYEAPWRYLEPTNRTSDLYAAEFNVNLFDVAQLVATTAFTNQTIYTQRDNTDLLLDLDYGYEAFPTSRPTTRRRPRRASSTRKCAWFPPTAGRSAG